MFSMHLRNPAQYHEMQSKSLTSSDLLKLPIGLLTRLFTFSISLAVFYSSLAFWCTHSTMHTQTFADFFLFNSYQNPNTNILLRMHSSIAPVEKKTHAMFVVAAATATVVAVFNLFWLLGLATKYWYVLKNRLRVNKPIASNFMTTHV